MSRFGLSDQSDGLHPGHVNCCQHKINADVRKEGSDAMATTPKANFVSDPLIPCQKNNTTCYSGWNHKESMPLSLIRKVKYHL